MAIVLKDGYLLEGDAGTASKIDYTVSGLDGITLTMLASGQLGDSKATLYTASGVDTIAGITLFNTHSSAMAVNLYVNDGTSRQVVGIDSLGAGYHALYDGKMLAVYDENGALVTSMTVVGAVMEADFDAQTILAATADDTPAALTVNEQTLVGRITGGNIASLTVAQLQSLLFSLSLAENVSIQLDPVLSADGKWSGITETGTAGTALAFGDLAYFAVADSKWEKAIATAAATAFGQLGMVVVAGAEDAAVTLLLFGKIRADAAFPALTIGAPVYISKDTAGDITMTIPPKATNHVVRIIGHPKTANELWFTPDNTYLEYA